VLSSQFFRQLIIANTQLPGDERPWLRFPRGWIKMAVEFVTWKKIQKPTFYWYWRCSV